MYVFFFNDTATTEIYTLSLHDALPILVVRKGQAAVDHDERVTAGLGQARAGHVRPHTVASGGVHLVAHGVIERSEEHTSELQSRSDLVCRLLLADRKG